MQREHAYVPTDVDDHCAWIDLDVDSQAGEVVGLNMIEHVQVSVRDGRCEHS